MKVPFTLREVGHFGLAVRDPEKSAKWFERALGLRKQFEFDNGVAVGNDYVTIALFKGKPSPETIAHMSFHLPDMPTLRKALAHLKKIDPKVKAIVSSGYANNPVIVNWYEYGFLGKIVKPYKIQELNEVVQRVLSTGD